MEESINNLNTSPFYDSNFLPLLLMEKNNYFSLSSFTRFSVLDSYFLLKSTRYCYDLSSIFLIDSIAFWSNINTSSTYISEIIPFINSKFSELSYLSTNLSWLIYTQYSFINSPSVIFDSYSSSINLFNREFFLIYISFFVFLFVLSFLVLPNSILSWTDFKYFLWLIYIFYTFSISKEHRINFEVTIKTIFLLILFFLLNLFYYDDNLSECLVFFNQNFFIFFNFLITVLINSLSLHIFSYLGKSISDGRSLRLIFRQFCKDIIDSLSIILRFYMLVFRINIYDTLEDFFDGYYIFIEDLSEDDNFTSLLNENYFFSDNYSDNSIFSGSNIYTIHDLFILLYIVWLKFFSLLIFIIEEIFRLSLAIYITFLVLYEIHTVNSSYSEDYFSSVNFFIR